jgi:hypothetical protein
MKTKVDMAPERFWDRVNVVAKQNAMKFKSICQEWSISYKTIMSNRTRTELPSLENAGKIAIALNVSLDYLLYGSIASTFEDTDPLYKLLSTDADLKGLIWRVVQCDASQLRLLKSMLTSWNIPAYDSTGKQIKLPV